MNVCVHQGFSNAIVSRDKRRAFSGNSVEEDWVPGTSQTEFHRTLSRDRNKEDAWWKGALATRSSRVCQVCDLQYPRGGSEFTVLQCFEFRDCLLRPRVRWKGGEWPIALNRVLGSSSFMASRKEKETFKKYLWNLKNLVLPKDPWFSHFSNSILIPSSLQQWADIELFVSPISWYLSHCWVCKSLLLDPAEWVKVPLNC